MNKDNNERNKYEARFALPVFGSDGEVERYNVFHAAMIFRHSKDGKMYLYDIMNIKKKQETFSSPKTILSEKPISYFYISLTGANSQWIIISFDYHYSEFVRY